MSKHAHVDLINKWLEDTSIPIESYYIVSDHWKSASIWNVIDDIDGKATYRLKPPDPYAELKQALKDGKRVAVKVKVSNDQVWLDCYDLKFNRPPDHYKIIPYDQTEQTSLITNKFGIVVLRFTKDELLGKLRVEII